MVTNFCTLQGHALRAFHLTDPKISATQLLAGGYDVVVCSYEFVDANRRPKEAYERAVQQYRETGAIDSMSSLKKPTTSLHSELWRLINRPWKRVVLDEAQVVSKRGKPRHESVKMLYAKAFVMLSGTLTQHKWYALSGYVDFLKGHAFTSHTKFLHTFGGHRHGTPEDPGPDGSVLLRRFLQPLLIARPPSTNPILKLKGIDKYDVPFKLLPEDELLVSELTTQFNEVLRKTKKKALQLSCDDRQANACLKFAVWAQLTSIHPMLLAFSVKRDEAGCMQLPTNLGEVASDDKPGSPEREQFLQELDGCDKLMEHSARLQTVMALYSDIRGKHPDEKIVVFSQYVKFLDIVAKVFREKHGFDAIRYDGTIPSSQRTKVEEAFKAATPQIPILMTAGAGTLTLEYGSAI